MRYILSLLFLLNLSASLAQSNDGCSNAFNLCGGQVYNSSNVGATVICDGEDGPCAGQGKFCFGVNNTVWFSFKTNQNGGAASVNIGNIASINGDDTLQVAIFTASTPCNSSNYNLVNCVSRVGSSSSIPLASLLPNTRYYIIVDGKGTPPPAVEAGFQISVTGPAVQNSVTATSTAPTTCSSNDGSIQVTAPAGSTYSINGNAAQANGGFTGLGAGSYSVKVTFDSGCDTTIVVELPSQTITSAKANPVPASCISNNGSISISDVTGGTRPYSFSLNGGTAQQDSTFTGLAAGTYEVIITDASDPSCKYVIKGEVKEDKPSVSASTVNADCGASNGSIVVTGTGAVSPYAYEISPAAGSQSGNTFSNLPAAAYKVIVTAANGCRDSIVVSVFERQPVTDVEVATENVNCSGSAMGSASVSAVQGGKGPYKYSLDGGSFQSSPDFPQIAAGMHTLTVRDVNGCELEKPFVVSTNGEVSCSAGADLIKYPGVETRLDGQASEGNVFWSPAASLSDSSVLDPVVNATRDQLYTMTVVTSNGCTCKDEVFVSVAPQVVPVPNAFTPNDDGANDVWRIPNLEYYDNCVVDVYTRWGQRVFHSEGYEIGEEWDGRHLGIEVPAASYYFVIDLNIPVEGAANILTGTVVIIR